jgi:hypothetical protein
MSAGGWRRRKFFNRRVGAVLLWTLLLLVMAFVANIIGIRLAGSIDGWQRWMDAHAGHFLVWRLLLYVGTIWGWLWMRRRLRTREPERAAGHHLLRAEIAAVVALIALEMSLLTPAG